MKPTYIAGYPVLAEPFAPTPEAVALIGRDPLPGLAVVGLGLAGQVVHVLTAVEPSPAQLAALSEITGVDVTCSVAASDAVYEAVAAAAAPYLSAGPGPVVAAMAAIAASGGWAVTFVAGQPPQGRTSAGISPMSALPRVSAAQLQDGAAYLAGKAATAMVAVADRHWRIQVVRSGPAAAVVALTASLAPAAAPRFTQLGMPAALADALTAAAGLVLVAGPARSGRSSTLAAMAARVRTTRPVLTATVGMTLTPGGAGALVPLSAGAIVAAARTGADLIIVDDLSPDMLADAAAAAAGGAVVLAGIAGSSVAGCLGLLLAGVRADRLASTTQMLAHTLLAVVAQQLLDAPSGPVLAAEVMMGTPAAAALLRSGSFAGVATVIEHDRGAGSVAMGSVLAALVASGTVELALARRYVADLGVS